jgi:hypothetical protein
MNMETKEVCALLADAVPQSETVSVIQVRDVSKRYGDLSAVKNEFIRTPGRDIWSDRSQRCRQEYAV